MRNDKNAPTMNVGVPTETSGKYYIKIFGCQYNEWDASRIDFLLQKKGLVSSNEKEADIIFVLSCSVRQTAIDRLFGKIHNWRDKKVIVCGCILESDRKKYLQKNVLVWDVNKPEELENILSECHYGTHQGSTFVWLDPESRHRVSGKILKQVQSLPRTRYGDDNVGLEKYVKKNTAAFLPIMTGCNNFCSYCVVPYTRGRETSRPFDEIVKNFQELIKKGNKEILLLGQNVNSYHGVIPAKAGIQNNTVLDPRVKPEDDKLSFSKLLETLNNIPGDFSISFTSNHPKDMTLDIILSVRDLPKVKKEIHLPLQSGSNKILKAMNRPYTIEQYLKLTKKIQKEIPNILLSTDIILGFPGETEEDFQETANVLKKINYSQVFVNKYSPRAGTAAEKLGDPILWEEKERRWRILDEISNKKNGKA